MSLSNNAKKMGDTFILLVSVRHVIQKKSDCMPLVITNDLIDLYIFNITRMTFPDIPHDISFVHRVALLIESNALL